MTFFIIGYKTLIMTSFAVSSFYVTSYEKCNFISQLVSYKTNLKFNNKKESNM